jgi:V8-like Glu-specific endopeptidase
MATPFGSIVGRVLGRAGAPVPGATVAAVGSTQPHRDIAAFTSADGTFRFGSMLPGVYRLEARASGAVRSADVSVAPGGRVAVEIQLAPLEPIPVPERNPELDHGRDERTRVANYRLYPWRCVCSLVITAASGVQRIGTGWLAAHRVVLTAGHCVHIADEGGWVAQVEVIPGRNGAERPFGSAISREVRGVSGWTEREDPDYDYGAILLPPDMRLGEELGWFGYTPRDDDYLRQVELNLAGYPGDGGKPPLREEGTQWFASGHAKDVMPRQLKYDMSTSGGEGGSPVWEMTSAGERYAVAIHTWGSSVVNGGTRITQEVFDTIAAWTREAS